MMRYGGVLLLAVTALAYPETVLRRDWQVDLGVPGRSVNYQSAVCPDGFFYLTNGLRQVVVLTPQGTIATTQNDLDGFASVVTMTCADDGTLYVVGKPGIVGYHRDLTSHLTEVSRVVPEVGVRRLAVGDHFFYAASYAQRRGLPLHLLDREGRLIRSFGDRTDLLLIPMSDDTGFPLWDPIARQVLFVPRHPYEISVYNSEGDPVRRREADGATILPVVDYQRQVQEVTGAVRLGDGRVVTQMRGYSGRRGEPAGFLDVFDHDLAQIDSTIPARYGFLAAGAAGNALYFVSATASGLTVTRAQLKTR